MALPLSLRLAVLSLVAIVTASGCTGDASTPAPGPTSAAATAPATATATRPADPDVIDFVGLRDILIGASMRELTASGVVATANPGCGPSFTALPYASPVFDGDELVLIWAYPPLRTPEGVMVGTSVDEARRAYPAAVELSRPAGSTQYPGLLVAGGDDRAYLLLYDAGEVQKLVVGMERYARLLFDAGFGTC